ncbi:MAG: aminomethyl-transferring glycine dehydrogenase subunit GcvPA [Candidatus Coatesbacteria bacterium]
MDYLPHTGTDVREMLAAVGVADMDALFADIGPELAPKSFDLPAGRSEMEVRASLREVAGRNATNLVPFVGGGFYDHYIPAAVDALASRAEFVTAYTPYQPECAQGTLQAMFEYQSAICALTGMDVSNASLYDGGTALYEAAMMAARITGRSRIVMDSGVSPIYRTILHTYTRNLSLGFEEVATTHGQSDRGKLFAKLDDRTAAVILQNPNFFGSVDDHSDIVAEAHRRGILVIQSVYPVALGLLKTPGEVGVDIATGEGQSLGLPLSFGGPYLGFMAVRREHMRKMPGRVVGETVDRNGRRCYVLTLQAREQHIRREKATSNICSNESLCALRSVIYLSLMGRQGLVDLAGLIRDKAEFAKDVLGRIPGVLVDRALPTFNEFTAILPRPADEVVGRMIRKGFVAGFPLGRYYPGQSHGLLVAVTEKRTREEIVKFAHSLEAVLCA